MLKTIGANEMFNFRRKEDKEKTLPPEATNTSVNNSINGDNEEVINLLIESTCTVYMDTVA